MSFQHRRSARENLRDADAVVVRSETAVDRALLEGTRVRFVGTATIGTDHVDLDYLSRSGIAFAHAPGSNANSVAEYLVAGLLVLSERLQTPLKEMSIAVIGVGNVGSKVERMARALGMQVLLERSPSGPCKRRFPLQATGGGHRGRCRDGACPADAHGPRCDVSPL